MLSPTDDSRLSYLLVTDVFAFFPPPSIAYLGSAVSI